MKMTIGNAHTRAILNKYEYIASQRQNAHIDGKLSYAEYLAAYNQYKRACAYYGETFCFVHITAPEPERDIEVSITQIDRHFEILIWRGSEQITSEPEWIWGWNYAKDRAFEIAAEYPGAIVVQPFAGKRIPVSK